MMFLPSRHGLVARISRRKTIEQVRLDAETGDLDRTLEASNLIFLGIGCIIGAGIFVRTGSAASLHAGPAVLLSFLIAGTVCALSAFCYAELGSTLPVAGSAYTYTYATIGEFSAWIMGSLLLLEYGLAASMVAVGWSGYFTSLLKDFGLGIPDYLVAPLGHPIGTDGGVALFNVPAFTLCLALTALLVAGVSESARVNNVIVMVKLAVLTAFIVVGGWHVIEHFDVLQSNWQPFIPAPTGNRGEFGVGGILRGASILFLSYVGFEAVSTAGQETRNPARDLPIGILGSLGACTAIYILVAAVMTLLVPYTRLNVADPLAVAVDALGRDWAVFATVIKIGAIIGLTSVVLVLLYAQTRVLYAMARDGLVPDCLSRVHGRFRTPWINTLFVGGLVAVAAGCADINTLGDVSSVGTLCAFSVVCFTVLRLRKTHPEIPRGFRVPIYPLTPMLGIISCVGLIFTLEVGVLIFFACYTFGAVAIYFAYGARNSRLEKGEVVQGHS